MRGNTREIIKSLRFAEDEQLPIKIEKKLIFILFVYACVKDKSHMTPISEFFKSELFQT